MTAQQRGIAMALALVSVLHTLLLWGWPAERLAGDGVPPHASAVSVRWLLSPAVRNEPVVAAPAPVKRGPVVRAVRTAEPEGSTEAEGATEAVSADTPPAEPAATAHAPAEPALRVGAVQRAAREAAHRKGVAEMSDEALGQHPVDAQAALRSGVASAGKKDCLRESSPLGLLALPFLVFDAATGRCAK